MSQRRNPETDIQKAVKTALERFGYLVRRIHCGRVKSVRGGWMALAEAGTADLIVQGGSFCLWLELKAGKGVQSEEQVEFAASVERRGGLYLTARSCEEAVNKVREIGGPC